VQQLAAHHGVEGKISLVARSPTLHFPDMARLRCLAAMALRTKTEQTVDMAKKLTKSDKGQRQAEGLEKKLERRPAQVPKKKAA